MQNTLARMGFTSLVALFSFCFFVGQVESKTIKVNCEKKQTIQDDGLGNADPGDVIEVSGTCNENVRINETFNNITLDGGGGPLGVPAGATINGAVGATINVRGRQITIKGFTIKGDGSGILVRRGGTVIIDSNRIVNNGRSGINVGQQSFARIINNLITLNEGSGILVNEGSAARVGFLSTPNLVIAPNNIVNNDGEGIRVQNLANARIVGNNIEDNDGDGIRVQNVAQARIAGNFIDGNGSDGIDVKENSGINLGTDDTDPPTTDNLLDEINTGLNDSHGVRCRTGSYVSGRIGTLSGGGGGATRFDSNCIDNLSPPTPAVCGNSIIEPTEECDDGNSVGGDGCSAICITEP